jgi:hypothetical protein
MADEVTKKDLQALQKDFNKQILDLKKRNEELQKLVDDNRHEFLSGLEEENKITVNVRKDFEKRSDEIQNSINALAKAIADIANKVNK